MRLALRRLGVGFFTSMFSTREGKRIMAWCSLLSHKDRQHGRQNKIGSMSLSARKNVHVLTVNNVPNSSCLF